MGVCGTTYELCREEDVFEVSVFVPDNKSYLRAKESLISLLLKHHIQLVCVPSTSVFACHPRLNRAGKC